MKLTAERLQLVLSNIWHGLDADTAEEVQGHIDALTEEVERLKSPGPCGKHPAACLGWVVIEASDFGDLSAKKCSACEDVKAAVEREREAIGDIAVTSVTLTAFLHSLRARGSE